MSVCSAHARRANRTAEPFWILAGGPEDEEEEEDEEEKEWAAARADWLEVPARPKTEDEALGCWVTGAAAAAATAAAGAARRARVVTDLAFAPFLRAGLLDLSFCGL